MTKSNLIVPRWSLARPHPNGAPPPPKAEARHPAPKRGVHLITIGDAAAATGLREQALAYRDDWFIRASFISNDRQGPKPIRLPMSDGTLIELAAYDGQNRLVLGTEGNTRDVIKEFPLLANRYLGHDGKSGLLRNIPVFETAASLFNTRSRGGNSIPIISAMDFDLDVVAVQSFLRSELSWLKHQLAQAEGGSFIERLMKERLAKQKSTVESWIIVVIFGGSGSCGNAGGQLLPYLLQPILDEMDIQYELWGVVLGPRAFTGLTPHIMQNYRALMHSLDYMARYGQHREYVNGFAVDSDAPPYSRLFLLDDPQLPADAKKVSENELEGFFDRAALNLYTLLNSGTGAWDKIASVAANPRDDDVMATDEKIRWLHTVNAEVVGVDQQALKDLTTATQEDQLLKALETRLTA